ncbi:MAG: glycosyltransferase family 39 protein [Chloroflexi bacterium]|nr:glycosyltransferase family 39 protein [Chloroflexota bacterium]MCL5274614.1 glycosyltransferase family 39 protein [Chloroflexota bacterium]
MLRRTGFLLNAARKSRVDAWALAFALLGFAARIAGLGAQSLYAEEGYSITLGQDGLARILTQTATLDSNTPLHYILLSVWNTLGGISEFNARALSAFAAVLIIPLAYQLVKTLGLPRAAQRGATLFAAVWPVGVGFAQEARMYALLMCLTMLATLLLARALRRGGRLNWAAWSISLIAAFATHVYGALIFGVQALVVVVWLIRRRRLAPGATSEKSDFLEKSDFWYAIAAIVITAAIIGAWTLLILKVSVPTSTTYGGRLNLFPLLEQGLAVMLTPKLIDPTAGRLAALASVALLLITFFSSSRLRLLPLLSGAIVLAICAVSAWTGKFSGRYVAAAAPLAAAGFGASVGLWMTSRIPARAAVARGLAVLLAALSLAGFTLWRADPASANEDYRGAAAYLRAHVKPGEPILMIPNLYHVFHYYYGDGDWHWLPPAEMINLQDVLDYRSAVPLLNSWLGGRSGAWLLLYDETLLDPSHIVQGLLRRQSVAFMPDQEIDNFRGLRLLHYHFFRPYQPLPDSIPSNKSTIKQTDRDRGLDSLGCQQIEATHVNASSMEVFCFWQVRTNAHLPWNTKVSLRLLSVDGKLITQSDQQISAFGLPTQQFSKPLTAMYVINLPQNVLVGSYILRVIPYTSTEEISPQIEVKVRIEP